MMASGAAPPLSLGWTAVGVVATEPDRTQFDAAGQRLDSRIEELLHFDANKLKRKLAREKALAERVLLERKLETPD